MFFLLLFDASYNHTEFLIYIYIYILDDYPLNFLYCHPLVKPIDFSIG
jgi:hypothetical protein